MMCCSLWRRAWVLDAVGSQFGGGDVGKCKKKQNYWIPELSLVPVVAVNKLCSWCFHGN